MGGYVVGAAVVVVLLAAAGRLVRRAWLDSFELFPGERVLVEVPVRAELRHARAGRIAVFARAHARVTDRRVLLGQRPMFGKLRGRYALFAIVDLDRKQTAAATRRREWAVMSARRRDVTEEGEWMRVPVETEAGAWSGTAAVWLTAGQGQPSLVRAIVSASGPPLPPV